MAGADLTADEMRAWRLLALLGAATLPGLYLAGFAIRWSSILMPDLAAILLHLIARFYRIVRPAPRIGAACEALAQLIIFTMIAGPLSYLAASLGGPLQDSRLAAMDALFGLDWRNWLALLDSAPGVAGILRVAYDTLMPQLAAVLLLLGFTGRTEELRRFVWATSLAGLAAVLISGLIPAAGCYAYFGLTPADFPHINPSVPFLHMADFTGLRDGSDRLIDLATLKGIITFPSFHAALATLYGWAFWQNRALRWPGLAFEALVLLATPVDGGHYFADVAAGMLIASVSLWFARHIVAPSTPPLQRWGRLTRRVGAGGKPPPHPLH